VYFLKVEISKKLQLKMIIMGVLKSKWIEQVKLSRCKELRLIILKEIIILDRKMGRIMLRVMLIIFYILIEEVKFKTKYHSREELMDF